MTFSTMETIEGKREQRPKPVKVAQALQNLAKEAFLQGKLSYGILECARILKKCPAEVVICVLQKSASASPEKLVQRKLIEAYCREKHVRLIQVDSCRKLTTQIEAPEPRNDTNTDTEQTQAKPCSATERLAETECLIITKSDIASLDEDFVVSFHDIAAFANVLPFPYITIPE